MVGPYLSPILASFRWPVQFCITTTVVTYVLSLITGNCSQVDRLWTFLPTIYTAYYAFIPALPVKDGPGFGFLPYVPEDVEVKLTHWNSRTLVMFILQFTWMCRLSYNTWRRGLFNLKDEDYRWEILRTKIPPWLFQVFNLTFIAITQNILLFLLALPTHSALISAGAPTSLVASDYILAILSLGTLVIEFTADNQQYAYQTFKHSGREEGDKVAWPGAQLHFTEEDKRRGFITKGIWKWSRHPNFACEQTFWILQNLFPILATPLAFHKSPLIIQLIPCLAICTLFFSSTIFTESISLSKYPEAYKAYQKRVAMFIPVLTPLYAFWVGVTEGLEGRQRVEQLVFGSKEKDE